MKTIVDFIDRCLCKYIGINSQNNIVPQIVKNNQNYITLLKTESHKRHSYTQNLEEFFESDLENLSDIAKQKLGVSLGKAVAKNLIISFEKVSLDKEDI